MWANWMDDSKVTPASFAQLEARQEREKRELIQEAIRSSKSVLHAAAKLGMKPSSLHTLITRLGMREELRDLGN